MAKIDKPLKYDANHIMGVHQLKLGVECEVLDKLTNVTGVIEPKHVDFLEENRRDLQLRGAYWNEEELKMNFLADIFKFARLREESKVDIFYERKLSWYYNGKPESVTCDCLLAKPFGVYAPDVPYFFLQEFKKQKQNEDAEGQMLLAMLIAQHKNSNGKPIYGCYIQGKFWVFTTLHDINYCVSRAYDATQKADLYQIIFVLRQLKHIILTELSV